jgi:hypothetical protein
MPRIAAVLYFSIVSGALAADQTEWQLKPSLKYDALCLLNVLSGDPYYLHYYQPEYTSIRSSRMKSRPPLMA